MRPDEKKHLLWIMLLTALIVVAFRIEINPIGWKYFHWANWDCGLAFFIGLIVSAGKEVVWDKWLHRGTPQFYDASWNIVNENDADGDHIGEVGALRLGKALWWLLARIAGWDGAIE